MAASTMESSRRRTARSVTNDEAVWVAWLLAAICAIVLGLSALEANDPAHEANPVVTIAGADGAIEGSPRASELPSVAVLDVWAADQSSGGTRPDFAH